MIANDYFKAGKLNEYDLKKLISYINYFDKNTGPAGVYNAHGPGIDLNVRSSQIYFFDDNVKFLKEYFNFFVLEQVPILELYDFELSYQYVNYNKGDFFKIHHDRIGSSEPDSYVRTFTISINLSDPEEYSGGELKVYKNKKTPPVILDKEPGSFLLFSSLFMHEVTPVTEGVRKALVIWVLMPKNVLVE
jgi:Rps23 Pro-64 3,4-dihydroxylase Tpa1-like proline 4-hydroxylase